MSEKRHLFDNPRAVKIVLVAFHVVCALLLAADLVVHRHTQHPFEELFGFYAVYGLVACVLLVLIAKELRKIFMRPEDYYDDGR